MSPISQPPQPYEAEEILDITLPLPSQSAQIAAALQDTIHELLLSVNSKLHSPSYAYSLPALRARGEPVPPLVLEVSREELSRRSISATEAIERLSPTRAGEKQKELVAYAFATRETTTLKGSLHNGISVVRRAKQRAQVWRGEVIDSITLCSGREADRDAVDTVTAILARFDETEQAWDQTLLRAESVLDVMLALEVHVKEVHLARLIGE
jgi:hypothetical protein